MIIASCVAGIVSGFMMMAILLRASYADDISDYSEGEDFQ